MNYPLNCPLCNKKLFPAQDIDPLKKGDDSLQCSASNHFFKYLSEQNFYLVIKKNPYYYTIKKNDPIATITVSDFVIDLNNLRKPIVTFIDPNFTYLQSKDILNRFIKLLPFS